MIRVPACGLAQMYPDNSPEYTIDNPRGHGTWVFMHFTTPFVVRTDRGLVQGMPGDCLINSPEYPQWHRGVECAFKNDWIHFQGAGTASLLNTYPIPLNEPFTPITPGRILPVIRELYKERVLQEPYWQEAMDQKIRELILETARACSLPQGESRTAAEQARLPSFKQLRLKMNQNLRHHWKVEEMAEEVSLSPERFAVLYKRFFNVSPIEDLLEARLRHAKALLQNSGAHIESIARASGFSSVHYFTRSFTRRFGISPGRFRDSFAAGQ